MAEKKKRAILSIGKVLLLFKWIGNSISAFVSTLMIFLWLMVGHFVLAPLITNTALAPVVRMTEYLMPLIMNWENYFRVIFLSRISYNAYQIYKDEWRHI